MSRIVFLLEEPSMARLLEGLMPRMFRGLRFLCVPHEGKHDLEKSIPRKLRAWKEPGARFVVVMDNDGKDCVTLRDHLCELCAQAGRPDALIRIPCQELEAWYIGDLAALAKAYDQPRLGKLSGKTKYLDPDAIGKPSAELERLIPEFQKTAAARRMELLLSEEDNRSKSFQAFLAGVRTLACEMGYEGALA